MVRCIYIYMRVRLIGKFQVIGSHPPLLSSLFAKQRSLSLVYVNVCAAVTLLFPLLLSILSLCWVCLYPVLVLELVLANSSQCFLQELKWVYCKNHLNHLKRPCKMSEFVEEALIWIDPARWVSSWMRHWWCSWKKHWGKCCSSSWTIWRDPARWVFISLTNWCSNYGNLENRPECAITILGFWRWILRHQRANMKRSTVLNTHAQIRR